jgi:hypothetical protein
MLWYAYAAPRSDGVKAWGVHAQVNLPPRSNDVQTWGSYASPVPHKSVI